MKIILTCSECGYHEWGSAKAPLMNKIKMWNHVKRSHPRSADRILQTYNMVPDHFYSEEAAA